MKSILNSLTALIFCCSFSISKAQDTTSAFRREFYISFASSSPVTLDLSFKKQIKPNRYFKIGLVALSADISESRPQTSASFPIRNESYSGGLSVGIEFRKTITKKLTFFHGLSIRGIYNYNRNINFNPAFAPDRQKAFNYQYNVAIPYSFGLLFQVYGNFHAAIEINPSVYYSYSIQENNLKQRYNNTNTGFRFDNRFALFSFVYRY